MTNYLIIIGTPCLIIIGLFDALQGVMTALVSEIALFAAMAALFGLIRKVKYIFLHLFLPLLLFILRSFTFFYLLFLGPVKGYEYIYLTFLGVPILIFEPHQMKLRNFAILSSFMAFFFAHSAPSSYYFRTIEIHDREAREILFILVSIVLILGQFFYWKFVNTAASRKITEQQVKLTESNHLSSLGVMAAGIAHEINNPLLIIGRASEVLEMKLDAARENSPEIQKLLDSQLKGIQRIKTIVEGLKTLSRDGRGDAYTVKELSPIILQSVLMCQENARVRKVKLEMAPLSDAMVECREVQLGQIMLNLIGNSFDATENTENPWVRVEIDSDSSPGRVLVRVTDSGKGIAKDIRNKIMEPFFTTKEIGKGTGLGLSISSSILKAHGGELCVNHSHDNTCFVVALPISETSNISNCDLKQKVPESIKKIAS